MKKMINKIAEANFSPREIFMLCLTLLLAGTVFGMLFSPKGHRMNGCHNGNNNGNDSGNGKGDFNPFFDEDEFEDEFED